MGPAAISGKTFALCFNFSHDPRLNGGERKTKPRDDLLNI